MKDAVAETLRTLGRIDILVNNAGIATIGPRFLSCQSRSCFCYWRVSDNRRRIRSLTETPDSQLRDKS